jgi:hypothetical protein
VSDEQYPHEAQGEQASAELNRGLRNCQQMVTSYRAMISDVLTDPQASSQNEDGRAPDGALFPRSSQL